MTMKLKNLYKRKHAMKLNKLIKDIKKTLSLDTKKLKKSSKEEAMLMIVSKLKKRKKKIKKALKENISNKEKKELKEHLLLIKFQIKKMEKLLVKLF